MNYYGAQIKSHQIAGGFTLKDIEISQKKGECLFVSGSSGSGKSLLFSLCCGVTDPDEGDVFFENKSIYTDSEEHRQHFFYETGVIFQIPAIISNLNIEQNLMLPLDHRFKDLSEKEKNDRITYELDAFHLSSYAAQRPNILSLGQASLLAISRALIIKPKMVIWDAPLNSIDYEWSSLILNRFEVLKKEGVTFLFFSNNKFLIHSLADRHYTITENGTLNEI